MALPARVIKTDVFAPPSVRSVPLLDRPREAEFNWLRAHAREYAGQWVALDGCRLLGAHCQLRALLSQLTAADRERNPLFHRVDLD